MATFDEEAEEAGRKPGGGGKEVRGEVRHTDPELFQRKTESSERQSGGLTMASQSAGCTAGSPMAAVTRKGASMAIVNRIDQMPTYGGRSGELKSGRQQRHSQQTRSMP